MIPDGSAPLPSARLAPPSPWRRRASLTGSRIAMAVRIALGAQSREVLSLVLRRTVVMTGVGLALGLAGALALSRLVATLLYGVPPHDPTTLMTAAALLGLVALVAGYVPARRAARVDAIAALKAD